MVSNLTKKFLNWLRSTPTVYLLRYEDEDGWDLLGVYSDEDLLHEGVMDAMRRPEFAKGVMQADKVSMNSFWPRHNAGE